MQVVLIFSGLLRFCFRSYRFSKLTEVPLHSNNCVMKIALPTIAGKSVTSKHYDV